MREITAADVERVFADREWKLKLAIRRLKGQLRLRGLELHAVHCVRADWRRLMKRRAR